MADDALGSRRRRRRRRSVIIGAVATLVVAGGGVAWAMSGDDGPTYRLATVTRADVTQTVDADGTLSVQDSAVQSFATSGTVTSVKVRTGATVSAGQTLATIDTTELRAAVTSARTTVATGRQKLADDEATQASDATTTAARSGASTTIQLISVETPSTTVAAAIAAVRRAQRQVVTAQSALDDAVSRLTTECTTDGDVETKQKLQAGDDDTVTGTDGDQAAVVTLADRDTTSDNPQTVAAGSSYSFAGLTAGKKYAVVIVPVVDSSACTSAISDVADTKGSASDPAASSLYGSLDSLTAAVTALEQAKSSEGGTPTSGPTSSSGPTGAPTSSAPTNAPTSSAPSGSGSAPSGSGSAPSGSGSARSGSGGTSGSAPASGQSGAGSGAVSGSAGSATATGTSGTTVTAAQIAADQKSIDAARAALAVAQHDMGLASLTTPIAGTVAAVDLATGDTVSASSTSQTVTVVGPKTLAVQVDVSLADIDLVKVGQPAHVTVDGRAAPLAATVSLVGTANTSSSTGSSSTYAVTVVLDKRNAHLYDGMGASVAVDVGTARNAMSVPVSAVHTTGTRHTVSVYSGGHVSTTPVTLGVQGADRVQIASGLAAGDQVALADLGAALPSSDSSTTSGGTLGGFGGTGTGTGNFTGGGPGSGAGAPPGGG